MKTKHKFNCPRDGRFTRGEDWADDLHRQCPHCEYWFCFDPTCHCMEGEEGVEYFG